VVNVQSPASPSILQKFASVGPSVTLQSNQSSSLSEDVPCLTDMKGHKEAGINSLAGMMLLIWCCGI